MNPFGVHMANFGLSGFLFSPHELGWLSLLTAIDLLPARPTKRALSQDGTHVDAAAYLAKKVRGFRLY